MKRFPIASLVAALALLALAACQPLPPAAPTAPTAPTAAPTAEPPAAEPPAAESPSAEPPAAPAAPAAEEEPMPRLADLAAQDLAQRLAVPAADVTLVEMRAVTWPDASLGCPQPGMAYAQVLTEGALITLRVGDQVYFYHSGEGRAPFLCEQSSAQGVLKETPITIDEIVPPPDSEID